MSVKNEIAKMSNIKKFYVYWHKFANSGLDGFDTKEEALAWIKILKPQKEVYTIKMLSLDTMVETAVKGK